MGRVDACKFDYLCSRLVVFVDQVFELYPQYPAPVFIGGIAESSGDPEPLDVFFDVFYGDDTPLPLVAFEKEDVPGISFGNDDLNVVEITEIPSGIGGRNDLIDHYVPNIRLADLENTLWLRFLHQKWKRKIVGKKPIFLCQFLF